MKDIGKVEQEKEEVKIEWEVCIAHTTLRKNWERSYIKIRTWYPVIARRSGGLCIIEDENPLARGVLGCGILLKRCGHLDGGNWKIRKVKEIKLCEDQSRV